MNVHSIRFKFTSAFIVLLLLVLVTGALSISFMQRLDRAVGDLSYKFRPAISAVLNADRDLYQARVAEVALLSRPEDLPSLRESYQENAQQALDRMRAFEELMSGYPAVDDALANFQEDYDAWLSASGQVFDLVQSGDIAAAQSLVFGQSLALFDTLRDHYDIAGEQTDAIGSELSETLVGSDANESATILALQIFVIVFTALVAYFVPKSLARAVTALVREVRQLNSDSGDLTHRLKTSRKDEVGELSDEFDGFLDHLQELVHGVHDRAKIVIDNVTGMQTGASKVSETSQAQLDAIDGALTSVNELTTAIREVAGNAQQTASDIAKVNELSDQGKQVVERSVEQIEAVSGTVSQASTAVGDLSEKSSQIASVLDVIRGIAEQTNLLALNAAIEAARAGEQGRGFAVVADEVRALAGKTQQSTEDIQDMIESLQSGVTSAVRAIENGLSSVGKAVETTHLMTEALDNIVGSAQSVSEAANLIATTTEEQSLVAQNVHGHLSTLADMGRLTLDNSQHNQTRSMVMATVAGELSDSVKRFRLA